MKSIYVKLGKRGTLLALAVLCSLLVWIFWDIFDIKTPISMERIFVGVPIGAVVLLLLEARQVRQNNRRNIRATLLHLRRIESKIQTINGCNHKSDRCKFERTTPSSNSVKQAYREVADREVREVAERLEEQALHILNVTAALSQNAVEVPVEQNALTSY